MFFLLSYKGACRHNGGSHNRNDEEKHRKEIVEDQMKQSKSRVIRQEPLGKEPKHSLNIRILRRIVCGQDKNTGKKQGKDQRNDHQRDKKTAIGCDAA